MKRARGDRLEAVMRCLRERDMTRKEITQAIGAESGSALQLLVGDGRAIIVRTEDRSDGPARHVYGVGVDVRPDFDDSKLVAHCGPPRPRFRGRVRGHRLL